MPTDCTCGDRAPASPLHKLTCPRYHAAYAQYCANVGAYLPRRPLYTGQRRDPAAWDQRTGNRAHRQAAA